METVAVQKNHKLILNNRKAGLVTGVLDVLSFNLNEILLETEQGMLMAVSYTHLTLPTKPSV